MIETKSFQAIKVLYLVVLVLSFGVFFIDHTFDQIRLNSKIVSNLYHIYTETQKCFTDKKNIEKYIRNIDTRFKEAERWIRNKQDTFYVFENYTINQDFQNILKHWKLCKETYYANTRHFDIYLRNHIKLIDFLITGIEKNTIVQQNKYFNIIMVGLLLIIIILVTSIYSIRIYIEYIIEKHSIYDKESGLYNRNYFIEELKTSCAQSVRYKYPLSILSIYFHIDSKTQIKPTAWEEIGGIIMTLSRASDIACRYDSKHVAIILPFTDRENAKVLLRRLKEAMESAKQRHSIDSDISFSIVEYCPEENPKEFIRRVLKEVTT